MSFTTSEGRREVLGAVAEATELIGTALAALGDAYELLDDDTADTLEEQLFRPLQTAYGRAQTTHRGFAQRCGIPGRKFVAPRGGRTPSATNRELIERAAEIAENADRVLIELQDSMLPVDVGDPELRGGIAEVRTLLTSLTPRSQAVLRRLGR